MPHRTLAWLVVTSAVTFAACGSRYTSATFHHQQISQDQLLDDVAEIREADGVERVTYTHDVAGAARLVITYEPAEEREALQAATERGYRRAPD